MPIPLIAGAAVGLKAIGAKLLAGGAAKGFLAKLGLGKLGIGKFFAGLFKKAGLKGLFKNPAKLMDTMQDIRQTARMVRQARMTATAVQQTARRITCRLAGGLGSCRTAPQGKTNCIPSSPTS